MFGGNEDSDYCSHQAKRGVPPTFWSLGDTCVRTTAAEMPRGADSSQPQF